MNRFGSLECFVAVVEAGQFSAAAARLGLGKSVVSRRVSELEEHLGARLLQRTTRHLALTEAGRDFYPRALQLLEDLAEAEQALSSGQRALGGRIRLAAPLSFGLMHLAPALNAFMEAHPGVVLDLDLDDSQVDLIREGVDLALRIGRLGDSSMVALPLAPIHFLIVASPAYLRRHGAPDSPEALEEHPALCYSNLSEPNRWRLIDSRGKPHSITMTPRLLVNNGDLLLQAAIAGLGIGMTPTFNAYRALREGQLIAILQDYRIDPVNAYVIYPSRRFVPQRVRILVEFLRERFGERPYWDEGII